MEEAIELSRRAVEQDPLSAHAYSNLGQALEYEDRLEESEAALRRALELVPQRSGTRAHLALTLVREGRGEEALTHAMRVQNEGFRLWVLAIVHHAMDHRSESDAVLRELVEKHAETMAYQAAEAYAQRGETDQAFEWLERAYAQRDGGLTRIKTSTLLRSLHGDPRWGAFLTKMGFDE